MSEKIIIEKLDNIEKKLEEQNLLEKEVLTMAEACLFLDISSSHLYKLTSSKKIPHYCPMGKKLYFLREELLQWMQTNPMASIEIKKVSTKKTK
jgi:excisionase family DNA binding protein